MRQVVSGSPSPSLGEEGGADSQLPIVMLKGQQSSQKVLTERIAQIMEKTESEIDELVAEEVRDCCLPALIEIANALIVPPRLIAHLCSDGPVQVEAEVYAEMKASGDGTNDTGVVHYNRGMDKALCFCDALSAEAKRARRRGSTQTWVLYGDFSLGEVRAGSTFHLKNGNTP